MQHKRTILLTGIPRSGTTLCCHLLNQQPNTVALHEPISSESFNNSDRQLAIKVINEFVNSSRTEVLSSGLVQSKQLAGSIPSNPVKSDDGHLRKEQVSPGQMSVNETLSEDFLLVVKHNALFTALVNDLVKDFTCYAVVRNPLATLLSWQTVDLPIHQGYVPMGELFDPILQKDLNERETIIDRQLYILRWFYRSFSENLDRKKIIRYEDIVDTNG
ncbi:MAG: sulfotransferase domain-containing protein, partial [Pseudomonadales bacterium]|nr:sulfotransferase domain-containing protein [Pseudomonadales bacterium]